MPMERPSWLPDFASLSALQSLLAGRYLTDGQQGGVHQGSRHGSSAEFAEYRDYVPGDDTRRLDWKRLARTDHLHMKLFDEETSQWIRLVVDGTASMRYRYSETTPSKWDMARATAATLASLFLSRGDGVGAIRIDSPQRTVENGWNKKRTAQTTQCHELAVSDTSSQWENLVRFLDIEDFEDPTRTSADASTAAMNTTFQGNASLCDQNRMYSTRTMLYECPLSTMLIERLIDSRRRTNIFLMSDFFEDLPTLWNAVEALRLARHEVTLIHILDPAELSFPFTSPGGWRDPENNRVVWGNPDAIRAGYQKRFAQFLEQMRLFAAERKIRYRQFVTDRPLIDLLVEMLLKY